MQPLPDQTPYPQYGWGKILGVTFLPGVAMILIGIIVPVFGFMHDANLLGVYYLAEAVLLYYLLRYFTQKEGEFTWRRALPWQQPMVRATFWALVIAVSLYAIFFRDYFAWPSLNSMAMSLMDKMPWWPPSSGLYPGRAPQYPADDSTALIIHYVWLMVAVGAASAMQTIYFRGFLLPRMDRFGWWAVLYNSLLFVVFHLASPFFWAHFLIFTIMWGVITYATRNVWIAVFSHVIFNTYGYLWLLLANFGLVSP